VRIVGEGLEEDGARFVAGVVGEVLPFAAHGVEALGD
jgi:hypothetical protein